MQRIKVTPKSAIAFAAALVAAGLASPAHAVIYSFDGGPTGTGTELGTAVNWTSDTVPNGATSDVMQFDETLPGNLSLTYNVTAANLAAMPGLLLNVTAGHTGSLQIDSTLTTNNLRLGQGNAITIANGAGPVTFGDGSGTCVLALGATVGTLTFANNSTTNPLTFASDVRFANGGGVDHTVELAGPGNFVFNNNLGPNNAAAINWTKTGTGTATFAGNTAAAGQTIVANGVLNVTGTHNITSAALPSLAVGTVSGQSAVVNVNGGTLSTAGEIWVGAPTAAGSSPYGAFVLNTGTVNSGSYFGLGRGSVAGGTGRGQLIVNGGTLNVLTNQLTLGAFLVTAGTTHVATLNGGTTNVGTSASAGGSVFVGENANAVLNVNGPAALNVRSASQSVTLAVASGITGTLNLGGTITTPSVKKGSGTGYLNFHGGTLRANAANASFLAGLTAATVYGEGGTIDNGGNAVTVGQNLINPTGNGVTVGTLAFNGTGFTAPPLVDITGGGGTGATAVANIDAGGNLTGVTITNPGTGYTSTPTFSFFGGPGVTQTGTPALATYAGGGLNFSGTGTTTLTGANTYAGQTLVTAGTLAVVGGGSVNGSSGITVNGANARFRQTSTVAVTPAITLTNGTLDGTGTVGAVTVGPSSVIANGTEASAGTLTAASVQFLGGGSTLLRIAGGTNTATPGLAISGTLSTAGQPIAVGVAAPLAAYGNSTTYTLATYANLVGSGSDFVLGTVAGLVGRQTASLNAGANALTLTISGGTPRWTGLDSAVWKVGTTGPNGNWALDNAPTDYLAGDLVQFDDSAAATTVTIPAAVAPTAVTFDNSTKDYAVSGPAGITGAARLTKTGTGQVTLGMTNSYTGPTVVSRGRLVLTGSLTGSDVSVSGAAGQAATMVAIGNVGVGAGNALRVGTVAGGTGVLTVSGGTLGGGTAAIAAGDGGFGTINVNVGTVTPGQFITAGIGTAGSAGIWNLAGGTVQTAGNNGGTLGATAGTTGVMNVTNVGNYNSTSTVAGGNNGLFVGESGSGVLNVSGNGNVTLGGTESSAGLDLGRNNVSTAGGVVNLGAVAVVGGSVGGGGTITTNVVRHSGAAGSGTFNFHGGTLRASAVSNSDALAGSGNSFMGGLTNAFVYGEGGTIDNNARNITITQNLSAPTGTGVTTIAVAAGGSGYVTAPLVTLTGGGGTGATANAVVSGGGVTGFVITNPGTGYTGTPTITLTGGTDNGTAATVGIVTRTTSASGGLTFAGTGTTQLSGTNTFTGPVNVTNGTLVLTGGNALADTAALTVASGAGLGIGVSETVGSLAGGGVVVIGGSSQTLTVGGSNASTAFAGGISDATNGTLTKVGAGTLTLSGFNDFAGPLNVNAGVVSVTSVARSTGANSVINLGSIIGVGSGGLRVTGTGETVTKFINLAATTASSGTLDQSGTGLLRFTGPVLASNAAAHTLTLQGSTSGVGQIEGVVTDGSTTAKTGVLKQGTGTWNLTAANTYTGTTTVAGGTLRLRYTAGGASASTPVLGGAGVQLNGGRLVFDYAGSASPLATIRSLLATGRVNNFASGQFRSTAGSSAVGLGYGDNGANQLTVTPALYGDADLNGVVNFDDFAILQTGFGQTNARFDQGDFDYNGVVNFDDFALLQTNFGQSLAGRPVAVSREEVAAVTAFGLAHAVPEPACVGLVAAVGIFAGRRRVRRAVRAVFP